MKYVHLKTRLTDLFYFPEIKYLHLFLLPDVEYCLENIESDFRLIHELKKDEEIFILIDMAGASFEHIPKEVLHFMANSPYRKYQKQIAIITDALGTKIIGNFYLSYFKPQANTRLFKHMKDAIEWFGFEKSKLKEIEQASQDHR